MRWFQSRARRRRVVNGAAVTYVYDAQGEVMAEYGGSQTAGGRYLVTDHLGSTRLVLDGSGGCVNRSDYLPYGFEMYWAEPCYGGNPLAAGGVAGKSQRFTSKERDAETGLDYFGARYISSAQGRFTSPDAPFADQNAGIPQSWNLYSSVRNDPMRYIDPSGRCTAPAVKEGETGICINLYIAAKKIGGLVMEITEGQRLTTPMPCTGKRFN